MNSPKLKALAAAKEALEKWEHTKRGSCFVSAYQLGIPNSNAKSLEKSGWLISKQMPVRIKGQIQMRNFYRISLKGIDYLSNLRKSTFA